MNVELINTGSELLLGRVLNTHQQWLCRRLADAGYVVSRQVAVPDTGTDIQQSVREALARADLIITTGGLGPTSDDITRELIARLLGKNLHEDPAIIALVTEFFTRRRRPMPASTRVQAMVPEGALVLPNPNGTAPGLAMEVSPNPFHADKKRSWIIMLPGPPRELRPMFTASALPLIRRVFPADNFHCLTMRSIGIGESVVEEMLAEPLKALMKRGMEIGYCARPGQVDVRLTATTTDAEVLISEGSAIVTQLLGSNVYAEQDQELEAAVVQLLTQNKQSLGIAESCTGGLLAHKITNVPGASAVFNAGVVSYSNEAKSEFLDVPAEVLESHGAVSEPVARMMAEGVRRRTNSTFGLGITGIAGPSGGTPEKPVGTVFIGLATPSKSYVFKNFNALDRESFKELTAQQALDLLRRTILKSSRA